MKLDTCRGAVRRLNRKTLVKIIMGLCFMLSRGEYLLYGMIEKDKVCGRTE